MPGSLLAMQAVPLPVIAPIGAHHLKRAGIRPRARQLGHADTRMTEKHYAHLAPSYVADTIRAHFPKLGIVEKAKVQPIRPAKGAGRRRRI
ncbi:MAG: hypothetical protein AAB223_01650 [Pseudomonadota bacterium]